MIATWPCPRPNGEPANEYAAIFDSDRQHRLLILPALFDEANKLRRLTHEVMRRLDGAGIDCFLPDMPGCNESLEPLESQSLSSWREAARAAGLYFGATHVLTIRAGAILAPPDLPGWRYAPKPGESSLRLLLRARLAAAREAGRDETIESMTQTGRAHGIELAGYRIGAQLFADLEHSRLHDSGRLSDIDQDDIEGSGLWLRAEPGENKAQADALAAIIAVGISA